MAYGSKYGKRFSEDAFIKFLNDWQAAAISRGWASTLSAKQKSVAFTKRGAFLAKLIVRRPEALADFQKAITLDPNNSEARLQLQSLFDRSRVKKDKR